MNKRTNIINGIDWWTIALFLLIALFGWMNIYGAGYNFEQTSPFSLDNRAGKQLLWLGISVIIGIIVLFIDSKTYDVLSYFIYAVMIIVLIITPFLASNVKGSYSWLRIGPLAFQPAEFAKVITALALAKFMGRYEYAVKGWRDLIIPMSLILLPALIIMVWQRETGSALVFFSFMLMFYRMGMSGKIFVIGFVAIIIVLIIFRFGWLDSMFQKVLQPHQFTRIQVLLGVKDDPTGAGYNVNQSIIAIGSGQFLGKGYLRGTQTSLQFVPEQDTDFIFCTVGEEWGFVGAAGLLLVYLCFLLHLLTMAERQRDTFSMIYAYSVVGIFFMHITINVGMVLGLLPVIGIPLPFFSYGGSSMIAFSILLFILLRLDAERLNKWQ